MKYYKKIKKQKTIIYCSLFVSILFSINSFSQGIYEGFNYASGTSIQNQTGGFGWTTTTGWSGPGADNRAAITNPLVYSGLSITGNYMSHTNYSERINRQFDVPVSLQNSAGYLGKPGTSIYLSYLYRKNVNTAGWFGQGPVVQLIKYSGLSNYDNEINKLGVGCLGNKTVFQIVGSGSNTYDSPTTITLGGTYFVVVKYDFATTSTGVSVFINPDPTANEPTPTFTNSYNQNFSFDGVYFALGEGNGQADIDEIHVGNWNDVTPDAASLVALTSTTITGVSDISTNGTAIDLNYDFSPLNASTPVTAKWSISNSRTASINTDGVIVPLENGTVTVSLALTNQAGTTVTTSSTINISNQSIASTLLAYEGFNLPDMTVYTNSGSGFGWGSNWTGANALNSYSIKSSNPLTFQNLSISGNYGLVGSNYDYPQRTLDQSVAFANYTNNGTVSKEGKVLWLSALVRQDVAGKKFSINLGNGGVDGDIQYYANTRLQVGYFGSNSDADGIPRWTLFTRSSDNNPPLSNEDGMTYQTTTSAIVTGQADFVVLKITFGGNSSKSYVDLFINPDLSMTPTSPLATAVLTATPAIKKLSINSDLESGNLSSVSIDEFRIGSTFDAVSPKLPSTMITSVGINGSSNQINVGQSSILTASFGPGNAGTSVTYTWASSNNSIATISGSGSSITAYGISAGITTITGWAANTVSTVSGTFVLIVTPLVSLTTTSLNTVNNNITVGGSATSISAAYAPLNAASPINYIWSVSNSSIASVSGSGATISVVPINAGVVTITAAVYNSTSTVSGTLVITVMAKPQITQPSLLGITISGINVITIGGISQLTAFTSPVFETSLLGYSFTSSNPSIVAVSATGQLSALSAGISTIIGTVSNSVSTVTGTIVVTVVGLDPILTTTGIVVNNLSDHISIYPVPANDLLHITSDIEIEVVIYNSQGEMVSDKYLLSGEKTINVSNYIKGLYFVKIAQPSGITLYKKVIIQ
jgi:hypothetical protein